MDGLLVYRQYLENVRASVKNYDLPELDSKEFMGILNRVNQIEDLSYIDSILKNAGLNLSFIGDRKFLDEKVVVKSKLVDSLYDDRDMTDTMRSALSDYMSMFLDAEDSIIDELNEISEHVSEVTIDMFAASSTKYYTAKEIVEKNQDTLRALFGAMEEIDKKLNAVEEPENSFVEEFFDEEVSDDTLELDGSDIRELISDEVEKEENKNEKVCKSLEKENKKSDLEDLADDDVDDDFAETSVEEDVDVDDDFAETSVEENVDADDDFAETSVEEDVDIDDDFEEEKSENIEYSSDRNQSDETDSDFLDDDIDNSFLDDDEDNDEMEDDSIDNSFLDDDLDDNYSSHWGAEDEDADNEDDLEDIRERDFLEDSDFDKGFNYKQKDFSKFLDSDEIKDETDSLLAEDLMDEDESYFDDTDPVERSAFEEATNYFLTGKSDVYAKDDLRRLYKSKEKIVDSEDVSDTDDAVAKMILAVADGIIRLPKITGSLFRKAKTGGRKMRENMIVEDDDDNG